MNLKTALTIFGRLEKLRYAADEPALMDGTEPIFDVRLDAVTDRDEKRTYRIRVTLGSIKEVTGETWQLVIDEAVAHECSIDVQNSGLELHA